jgi:hypothetical protein
MDAWLGEAVKRAGLPPLADIRAAICEERETVVSQALDGPFRQRLDDVLNAGREYMKLEQAGGSDRYTFTGGPMPPLLLGDGKFLRPKNGLAGPTFSEPGDWLDRAHSVYARLREFVDACIV